MKLKEHFFTHNGVKIYYFSIGKGHPLLFLPGGLSITTYLVNILYLSKWYRVIAVDLPGFGRSSVPKEVWGLDDYASFLTVFLEEQNLSKIHVVGHSFGGGVALYLSMKKGVVSKLVAFDPMGVASDYSRLRFYFNVLFTKTVNDYKAFRTNKKRAFIFNNALSTIYKNFANVPKMFQIANYCLYKNITPKELKKITVPVKLVWGKYDELFPVANGKYLQEHIPKSNLEIVSGNHDWWTIHPEMGGDKVRAFLTNSDKIN